MTCSARSFALLQLLLLAACEENEDPPAAQGSTSGDVEVASGPASGTPTARVWEIALERIETAEPLH